VKKTAAINISLLASVAATLTGCGPSPIHVHLNAEGHCVNDIGGQPVDDRVCRGYGGGYFGGVHYVYVSSESAPYYSSPSSPGYVPQWTPTSRGIFGDSAGGEAHGGGGEGAGAGAGE
jgi:hypothetical protein